MKKFFTMLMASASVLCANAANDLTFDVTTEGTQITVTPSNDTDSYFAVALDEYTMMYWSMWGASAENPDMLLLLASGVYSDNVFTGAYTFENLEEETYVVLTVAAHKDGEDLVTDGNIYVKTVEVSASGEQPGTDEPGDEPQAGDCTFAFESDGPTFTVTPSDLEQPYYLWVFSQEEVDMMLEAGFSLEDFFAMYTEDCSEEDILTGVTTQSGSDDWWLEDYGTCYVLVAPMAKDGRFYNMSGEITTFVWDYNDGTTVALDAVAAPAAKAAKAMVNGRIVLGGRYNLNGCVVK